MANGHGGARPGAGRKKKSLTEKILTDGNGHHKITKLKLPEKDVGDIKNMSGNDMPPISEYLKKMTKNTNENLVPEIYEKTWQWLKARGCEQYIKTELIEQYALYIARWVQCEEGISTYGLLAKHPTTGSPIASPYVSMGINFLKQANIIWNQIFQIVKENSSVAVESSNPNDEIMARLLRGKG
ncbi:MAG: terminase [Christensenellales bacterium]|jgi:hypothetical protein